MPHEACIPDVKLLSAASWAADRICSRESEDIPRDKYNVVVSTNSSNYTLLAIF